MGHACRHNFSFPEEVLLNILDYKVLFQVAALLSVPIHENHLCKSHSQHAVLDSAVSHRFAMVSACLDLLAQCTIKFTVLAFILFFSFLY